MPGGCADRNLQYDGICDGAANHPRRLFFIYDNPPGTFDLILMDIMMPVMNAHLSKPIVMEETVKTIARNINGQQLPVV